MTRREKYSLVLESNKRHPRHRRKCLLRIYVINSIVSLYSAPVSSRLPKTSLSCRMKFRHKYTGAIILFIYHTVFIYMSAVRKLLAFTARATESYIIAVINTNTVPRSYRSSSIEDQNHEFSKFYLDQNCIMFNNQCNVNFDIIYNSA